MELYRQSAEQGIIPAMDRLGHLYEEGILVPKDMHEAIRWYRRAELLGSSESANHLVEILKNEHKAMRAADKVSLAFLVALMVAVILIAADFLVPVLRYVALGLLVGLTVATGFRLWYQNRYKEDLDHPEREEDDPGK